MKHLNLSWFLVLCLGSWAAAAPAPLWLNNTIDTTWTNIDATVFLNYGTMFIDNIESNEVNSLLFQTQDTLYFTNTGVIYAQPGFIINTHTATTSHASGSFNNSGSITLIDAPPVAFWANGYPAMVVPSQPPGTGGAAIWNGATVPNSLINTGGGTNQPVPSGLVVSATNIIIPGTISTGDLGFQQYNGARIDFSGGSFAAGILSEVDTNALSARGVVIGYNVANAMYPFFTPPPVTYDVAWAVANGSSYQYDVEYIYDSLYYLEAGLDEVITPGFPVIGINAAGVLQGNTRNGTLEGDSLQYYGFDPESIFPINTPVTITTGNTNTNSTVTPVWTSYVYYYELLFGTGPKYTTNDYYNIMYVNTATADADMTVQAAFYGESINDIIEVLDEPLYGGYNTITNGNPYALEGMVQFSAPVTDVTTGQIVTNSIYLLDTSGIQVPAFYATNSVYQYSHFSKPLGLEITRNRPIEWTYQIPGNEPGFDPAVLLDYVKSETVPFTNSFYVAQVGRNPEVRSGLDPYTARLLGTAQAGFPDPTNEPGQIQINASSALVVSNMMLRAKGFVTMDAPILLGTPAATDFPNWNADLGSSNKSLLVSHLFPGTYHEPMGDIAVYTADWANVVTNDGLSANESNITINTYYHVLIVDQDLRDTFQTTGLNLALRGSNVVVDDALRVIGSDLFQATNLTINSNLVLTGNAGTLQNANVPVLKNWLIGSNGAVLVDKYINLGVAPSISQVIPTAKNTPILSITNGGLMSSGETELQSQVFALGGTNVAAHGGSIVINAITNYLGAGVLGLTNLLAADGNVALTGNSIQATNSTILAGQAGFGQLILNVTGELTDHLPNTPSTNVYSTNFWQVNRGFSLTGKLASGDLFGTQILTIASNASQTVVHVWAGQDRGATAAGFLNNQVIGHLILDRTAANATLRFSAAGTKNAMYVDYLEMRDLSFSDYHHGLTVDGNFTIYFANSNVDPDKLQRVYPNIVWVPQFAGPNSTAYVKATYAGGASNVPMNAALRNSGDISTTDDGIVNANNPTPLNNTNAGPFSIPSPSLVTSTEALPVTNASGQTIGTFKIFTTGLGSIKANVTLKGVTNGQKITLTAVPSNNWYFLSWSWPTNMPPSLVTNPSITFPAPAAAFSFVTANFITNPFIGLAGVYNGLFSVPGHVSGGDSGFVTFSLKNNGLFTGSLRFGSTNFPFFSQFNLAQAATALATNGNNVLTVNLTVGESALPDKATGSVTNGKFKANLTAYHAPPWTAANPAPQAGTYTLVLPGNTNAAAGPGGDSYGTAKVDASGNLTAIVTLADNVSFSQGVQLSKEGMWPLYFAPSGVPQPLLGWVAFDTNGIGGRPAGLSGTVTWTAAAGPGHYYTNGFTNSSMLLGSVYSAAYQLTNGLALTNPAVALSGGNLPADVTDNVSAIGLETYQAADKSLTLTIKPATGYFTGQYVEPGTGLKVPLNGVVLQYQRAARGFFLGTNQSGEVWLQGN